MPNLSPPTNISERAHQVGIITLDQLRECWDELGSRNAAPDELVRMLQRKGFVTPFQIDKLMKGETSGYFYGGNKVLYKVASGGFARVYRGINVNTGESTAIKVLRQRWTSDKASIEAFYLEGRVGMTLRHPNIVRIDEVAGHDSVHYIAMEFVEGGNLRDFLHIRGGRLERGEAIRMMLEALEGLSYAHSQGVMHRDIKLTNLLASTQGVIKLVDFGLATVHNDEIRAEEAHGQRTVEYARLEKTTGVEKGDPRSDVFFLGTVFYQMLSGVPPIPEKKDRAARLLRTRLDNIRPITEVYPNVDRQLASIVDRMMSLNARARYQTPQVVVDDLRSVAAMAPVAIRSVAVPGTPGTVPAPSGKAPTRGRSVLVVESDPNLQATIREKLHALGYRVILTSDPQRGLVRYREQPADCVVVDCETTGKAGFDCFVETESHARNLKLPWNGIALVTPEQAEWSSRITPSDSCVLLVKPTTMKQLRQNIQRMVPVSVEQ